MGWYDKLLDAIRAEIAWRQSEAARLYKREEDQPCDGYVFEGDIHAECAARLTAILPPDDTYRGWRIEPAPLPCEWRAIPPNVATRPVLYGGSKAEVMLAVDEYLLEVDEAEDIRKGIA